MQRVRLSTRSREGLRRAPPEPRRNLHDAIASLGDSKARRKLDIKELKHDGPGPALFRLRVGSWRAVFRVRGADIEVLHVFPRRDGYGWMERLDPPRS